MTHKRYSDRAARVFIWAMVWLAIILQNQVRANGFMIYLMAGKTVRILHLQIRLEQLQQKDEKRRIT